MRSFIFVSLLFSFSLRAETGSTFDEKYQALEHQIDELKTRGEKITTEKKRELDESMRELRAEYEKSRAQALHRGRNFGDRASSAWDEVSNGFSRAWRKLEQE